MKTDPYIYPILTQNWTHTFPKIKSLPQFWEIYAKFVLNFQKVWEGVIHLPEGWKWDRIPRHVPNTSFNMIGWIYNLYSVMKLASQTGNILQCTHCLFCVCSWCPSLYVYINIIKFADFHKAFNTYSSYTLGSDDAHICDHPPRNRCKVAPGSFSVYGHVSEGGPPIGWRCEIFPEKWNVNGVFKLKMITYTIHFDLILKLNYSSLIWHQKQ